VTNSSGKPQQCTRGGRRPGAGFTRSAQQRSEFEELVGPARTTSPPRRVGDTLTVLTEDRPLKRDRDQTLFFPDHLHVAHDNLRKREGGILATSLLWLRFGACRKLLKRRDQPLERFQIANGRHRPNLQLVQHQDKLRVADLLGERMRLPERHDLCISSLPIEWTVSIGESIGRLSPG
jgi:hypothetical protein